MFFFFNGMGRNPGQTHTLERLHLSEGLGTPRCFPPETLEVVGEEREVWASPAQIDAQ